MEAAMTTAPDDVDPIFQDRDGKLIKLGFVPGLPIYETHQVEGGDPPIAEPFTVETLKRALFESSYSKPVVVPLRCSDPDNSSRLLPMVVELAQAIYEPMSVRKDERPVGCWEYPDWYLRGYLHKSPFDATAETIRMHAYLNTEVDTRIINEYYVQLIHQQTTMLDAAPSFPEGKVLSPDRSGEPL